MWICCNDISTSWGGGGGTQQNPLNEVSWLSKFEVSSFSMTGDTDIQTGHFAKFDQFKIKSFFWHWGILLSLGKNLDHKKQSKPSGFDKKFKNHT